jgi:glycosyltransferase involved in cell wall biosynthesis
MSLTRLPHLQWICWQPTHYNDFLFRSLVNDPEMRLTVHFMKHTVPSHPWTSQMAHGFKSRTYRCIFGIDWHLLRLAVRDKHSFFILGGWHDPTIVAVINLLMVFRRPFAIWTDTPDVERYRTPVKAFLRDAWLQCLFKHARYVMGTGNPALVALRKMGCPQHKLVNFPFFVDLDFFVPDANVCHSSTDKHIVYLSAGRLVNAHKGYDLAIKALSILRARMPTRRFIYRIAGIGPDKEALESLARHVGISQYLEFVGWLEPAELPQFYRSGHVFLHPSHFDPYPNAVLEAMAAGLPVIGSDQAGSVVDRIEHMHNGMIHRADDVHDLAEKIFCVLSHIDNLYTLGKAARCTAELWPVSRGIEIIKSLIES